MGVKSRSKKRPNNNKGTNNVCAKNTMKTMLDNGDIDTVDLFFTEDCKQTSKELPFASISNKQFKLLGMSCDKKPLRNMVTVPLKFPGNLMPVFRKIFKFNNKKPNKIEIESNSENKSLVPVNHRARPDSYVTLISFQNYIQHGKQMKQLSTNLPTLQVTNLPSDQHGLYLSASNVKSDILPNAFANIPIPLPPPPSSTFPSPSSASSNFPLEQHKSSFKITKKRSFFNEIWKKKLVASTNSESISTEQLKAVENQPSSNSPVDNHSSNESIFTNICIVCKQQAYLAERIQIGADVFHNNCFKCFNCSKCLYRGKWNKHQEQYLCDNCNKKISWSFVRR